MKDEKITIRMNGDLKARLQKLADKSKRTLSDFIVITLEDSIVDKVGDDVRLKLFEEKVMKIKKIAKII